MPGRSNAVLNGDELARLVVSLGQSLGLETLEQVRVARRIWGAERFIDVVLIQPVTRKTLGLECKYQAVRGTAEEKIPATIKDIEAWPIPGLVVFAGDGFTENMRSFLISTGKGVEFEDLRPWLCLFFGLPGADLGQPLSRRAAPAGPSLPNPGEDRRPEQAGQVVGQFDLPNLQNQQRHAEDQQAGGGQQAVGHGRIEEAGRQ